MALEFSGLGAKPSPAAAFSTNGDRKVVFGSNEFGSLDIFFMNPDGTGRERIAHSPDCSLLHPRWSPDGSRIAYSQDGCWAGSANGIVIISRGDGSQLAFFGTTFGTRADLPLWSPNGATIAYRCAFTKICLRNSDGSGVDTLLFDISSIGKTFLAWMDWSPDGANILATLLDPTGGWELWKIYLGQGGGAASALPRLTAGGPFGARYSPDGYQIVYNRRVEQGVCGGVLTSTSDGDNSTTETELDLGISNVFVTDWGEDGRLYVFTCLSGSDDIYSNFPDGSALDLRRLTNNNFYDYDAQLSPLLPGSVEIDIKPGSFPNSINLGSSGTVPVAIFSTATFDATAVDPSSVTLASASVRLRGNGTSMASIQDVNGDGRSDLVVHVVTEALQLNEGDVEAVLEGRTFGGVMIRGADSVRVVP
ncbi:MAG: PD40 domain-containing protein [Chloroflexi bacterium]|nr:PD40 domain-containing protein [Chloroflexota bacterium]